MKKHFYLIIGLLVTPLALYVSFRSAGFGHGTYILPKILFAFPMTIATIIGSITMPTLILGISQFPLYGFLFDRGKWRVNTGIVIFHLTFMIVNFLVKTPFG